MVEGTSKSKSIAGREALKQATATAGKKHMQTANVSLDARSDDCTASGTRRRSLAALLALLPDRRGRMSEANNHGQGHRQQKRLKVQGDRRRPDSVATNNDSSSRARGWRTPPPSMTLDGENRSHAKAAPLPLSPTQHVEGLPAMAVILETEVVAETTKVHLQRELMDGGHHPPEISAYSMGQIGAAPQRFRYH